MDNSGYIKDLENRLLDIERDCNSFANDILTVVCKRAIRKMNKWNPNLACGHDDYPTNFKFFDILSVELQTYSYCDINPYLEDAVEGALASEYDKLSPQEKFFVRNYNCSFAENFDDTAIIMLLNERFNKLYNEHWSESKKIQHFEDTRTW